MSGALTGRAPEEGALTVPGFRADEFEGLLARSLSRTLAAHFPVEAVRPLAEDIQAFCTREGKRVRPMLYIEARRGFAAHGGEPLTRRDMMVAVALEAMHSFILAHDDIIDQSETRRGEPSLHKLVEKRLGSLCDRDRLGRDITLVIGDFLFAFALKCLIESGVPHAGAAASRLLDYMMETGVGEIADVIFSTQDLRKVEYKDIEWMYWLKTTRYTVECPLVLAAIVSGMPDTCQDEIARVVAPAGLAFQIENDLKDYRVFEVSDAVVPGDILEGKKTAIVRKAFDLLDENDQTFLRICLSGGNPTEATVGKARELIYKSGAIPALHAEADALMAETFARLESSTLPGEVTAALADMMRALGRAVAPTA